MAKPRNTQLPISIGILAWHSGETLVRTLESYRRHGLLTLSSDITVFFQESLAEDVDIAQRFGIRGIFSLHNLGLGKGFAALAEQAEYPHILLLEHDWKLVESRDVTFQRISEAMSLVNDGFDCIRLRHRKKFGYPHMAIEHFRTRSPDHIDDWIRFPRAHLLESVHWRQAPDRDWPDSIQRHGDYFVTTSRYGCFTNNPCVYTKAFYLKNVAPFAGIGYSNEQNISFWWARQNFKIAQGEGLFQHDDRAKYGSPIRHSVKQWMRNLHPFVRNQW